MGIVVPIWDGVGHRYSGIVTLRAYDSVMSSLRSYRFWTIAALAAAVVLAMLLAIDGRGPWYDEFYSYYVTRPGTQWLTAWPVWMRDNHPPLFYALAWATNGLGETMAQRRLVNIGILVVGCLALWLLYRRNAAFRKMALPYLLGLASFPPAIYYASELRSNFLVLASSAVAVAALSSLARPNHTAATWRGFAFLVVALAVGFSVHLTASVILGALGVAFGVALICARDWRGVRVLLIAGIIAILPFALSTGAQFSAMEANTRSFWIPAGFTAARWSVQKFVEEALFANWVLTIIGVGGLGWLAWRDLRQRQVSAMGGLALTLCGGMALAIVVLLALHMWRPLVIDRYLIGLAPPMAMLLAVGVLALIDALKATTLPRGLAPLMWCALVLGTFGAIYNNLNTTVSQPSWDGTARTIAGMVRRCPGTVVHADQSWNQSLIDAPPVENRTVVPFAYRWAARRHGIVVEPQASRVMATDCPTLFWSEHVAAFKPDDRAVADHLRARGFAVTNGHLHRIGRGWIFIAYR